VADDPTARPRILVGVGAGIAAFKVAALVSRLVQTGHDVRCALSPHAAEFVGRATFEGLTGRPAIVSSTQVDPDGRPPHIHATRDLRAFVVAPGTAGLIAKLAHGIADDPITLAASLVRAPRIVCPAMNDAMWHHPSVARNLERLRAEGWQVLGPVEGHLAEGYAAIGRMVEPDAIEAAIAALEGAASEDNAS
jgi:phosphopantothenoylcysteine synthetase/decarboxylase